MAEPPAKKRRETVAFNVGGKPFEVLREPTLSMHPSSLLSQLAEAAEGEEPIFVEADPELFRYLLAFHRHRAIHIPFTVSKEEILQEARALNLPVKPEDVVQETPDLSVARDVVARELENIAKSTRADEVNLVRDIVLNHMVTRINGTWRERRLSLAGVIKQARHSEGLAQVDREELKQSLQPWACKHGFTVRWESQPNAMIAFAPIARAPNLPVEPEHVVQEAPQLCVLNEAAVDACKRVEEVRTSELLDIAKSRRASEINLVRDLVLKHVVTQIKDQRLEGRFLLVDVEKRAGHSEHLAQQNVEEFEQSLQSWCSKHGFQMKQRHLVHNIEVSFAPAARASS